MVFAPAWRRSAGARFWPIVVPRAASAFPPKTRAEPTESDTVLTGCEPGAPVGGTVPRLKRRAEFVRVTARGRKTPMPGFVLQVLPRDDTAPARIGFTVTKKVGNAVVRNRTRRRLREAARLLLREMPVTGADLVLVGRDGTRKRDFALLIEDLRTALARCGLPKASL